MKKKKIYPMTYILYSEFMDTEGDFYIFNYNTKKDKGLGVLEDIHGKEFTILEDNRNIYGDVLNITIEL